MNDIMRWGRAPGRRRPLFLSGQSRHRRLSMDDTACAAAAAAPAIEHSLAEHDPNPSYLAALAGAHDLAEEARVCDLASALADPKREDLVSALMCHELASCHRLMMRFGAMADHYLSHTSPTID